MVSGYNLILEVREEEGFGELESDQWVEWIVLQLMAHGNRSTKHKYKI